MIRPNPIWLAAIVLSIAASPAPADVAREASQRDVPAADLKGVRVFNLSGRVTLRSSPDGQLHLRAVKVLHGAVKERTRLSAETRVDATDDHGIYVVRVSYQQRALVRVNFWDLFSNFELPHAEVELTLDIPGPLPVQVSTASGDVGSADLSGPQQITTSSGDVRVRDAHGPVEAKTSSGDIRADGLMAAGVHTTSGDLVLSRVQGPLTVRTSSGDVTVLEAADSISVVTTSGDIRVDRSGRGLGLKTSSGQISVDAASGRVSAESISGDVRVGLRPPLRSARIACSSGDVGVDLGPGLGCALELRTSSGTLDVSAPVQVGEVNRHSLTATYGHGSTPVTIRTTSGDIHVTSGGR